jgi:agmatinase
MSHHELFVSPPANFSGFQKSFEQANYVIIGVPFDVTSTYRTGARFGPLAIRQASLNIETYSFRSGVDVEDLKIHDLGDLHVSSDVNETLRRLELVVKDIAEKEKTPIIIGGEHTITLGAVKGMNRKIGIVSFDAHLDLRNKYMELTTSHTTFMRRINEHIKPEKIVEIGTRAVCKEELEYAKKAGVSFFTVQQIRKDCEVVAKIEELLKTCNVYLTIDMDVLDPAYAPAVQNPEPDGLDMATFLDILSAICACPIVALDLVEVAPNYDSGLTAIQAAKILFEALCQIEKTRKV